MDYNLMQRAYCASTTTTWSGLAGYSNYALSYDELLSFVDENTTVTGIILPSGQYFGIEIELGRKFIVKNFKVYSNAPESDKNLARFLYKDSYDTWQSKTPVNYNSEGYFYWVPPAESYYDGVATDNIIFEFGTVSGCEVYEVEILNWDDPIDFGMDGSEDAALSLPAAYSRPTAIAIYNDNPIHSSADARVLPAYTGDYDTDRIIKLSDSYSADITTITGWNTIDDGYNIPDPILWSYGAFSNTEQVGDTVRLQSGQTTGTWTSPVIYVADPSHIVACVYATNKSNKAKVNKYDTSINEILEARASNDSPIDDVMFALWCGRNETYQTYAHAKYIIFESDGSDICFAQCGNGYSDRDITMSNYCWNFNMGIHENGQVRWNMPENTGCDTTQWINNGRIKWGSRNSCSYWKTSYYTGYSQIETNSLYFDRTFACKTVPIPGTANGWYVWNFVYSPGSPFGSDHIYITKLNNWSQDWNIQITPAGSSSNQQYNSACLAYDCLGLWVYYYLNGNAYFKKYSSAGTELASFSAPVDTFYWLEPSPDPSLNGFWAIGKTIIRWYEHSAYQVAFK